MKLSLSLPGLPLLLIATLGVCFLSGKGPERPLATVRDDLQCSANIDTMAMAADGWVLATSDGRGMVQVWCPETGRRHILPGGQHGHVRCVALTPDGATLATGEVKATISVWDVASGKLQWSVPAGSGVVRTVGFSHDGMTLAAGASDALIYLWDRTSHRLKTRLCGHTNTITAVAFAPDSRTLVSGSQDGTIRCWDAVTGQPRWITRACSGVVSPTVLCLRYSPDGKRIATAVNNDPALRLWNPATGLELPGMCGLSHSIVSVDFSPDGASLAAGDSRGSLTIWDVESRRTRVSWHAHHGWIRSVAFSADGRRLASAGEGAVKLWEIPAEEKDPSGK